MSTHASSPGRPLAGGHWPDERQVRSRLAAASVQLVSLRCEVDQLQADLAWLQVTAAGGPDLGDDE